MTFPRSACLISSDFCSLSFFTGRLDFRLVEGFQQKRKGTAVKVKYQLVVLVIFLVFLAVVPRCVERDGESEKPIPTAPETEQSSEQEQAVSSKPLTLEEAWEQHARQSPETGFANLKWKPEFGGWQSPDEKSTFALKLSEQDSPPAGTLADRFISDLHNSRVPSVPAKLGDDSLYWVTFEQKTYGHTFFVRVWWKNADRRVLLATAVLFKSNDVQAGSKEFREETDKLFEPLSLSIYDFKPVGLAPDSRASN